MALGFLCDACGATSAGRVCDACAWTVFSGGAAQAGGRGSRRLVVTMGAPGSGKSTYAGAVAGASVVSTDALRGVVDRSEVDRVFNAAFAVVVEGLKADRTMVLDTTAANRSIRERALRIARGFRAESELVIVDTPVEVCVERQSGRECPVSEESVRAVWLEIDRQRGDVWAEGWDRVVEIPGA